jgi:hypothetical protein
MNFVHFILMAASSQQAHLPAYALAASYWSLGTIASERMLNCILYATVSCIAGELQAQHQAFIHGNRETMGFQIALAGVGTPVLGLETCSMANENTLDPGKR